jgi:hypothetical protein
MRGTNELRLIYRKIPASPYRLAAEAVNRVDGKVPESRFTGNVRFLKGTANDWLTDWKVLLILFGGN